MKKIRIFLTLILAALLPLCGCAGAPGGGDKLTVICTTFPQYDWLREITSGAPGVELSLLVTNGVDVHSYQPSAGDVARLSSCNLLVCVGGPSEEWIEDVSANARGGGPVTLRLTELISERLLGEGHDEHDGHDHDEEPDEHVWLSLKNAAECVRLLAETLASMDGENAELYSRNAGDYIERLNRLDGLYADMVSGAPLREVVFADRFPFLYLMEDYGIGYSAAYPGCSAETEASFETVTALIDSVNAKNLPAVLVIDGSDESLARTVIDCSDNKNRKIITLDSMQSVTSVDISNGVSYLSVMRANLTALSGALGVN